MAIGLKCVCDNGLSSNISERASFVMQDSDIRSQAIKNASQLAEATAAAVDAVRRGEGVAVLIPCYNEAPTIAKVVADFRAALPEATVYVYDNNSTDGTADIAAAAGAVVRRESRQGKGNVVRSMFRDVDAEYYLMVDGDDTYPAEAAPELLAPLMADEADMVVGDRLSNGTYGEENDRENMRMYDNDQMIRLPAIGRSDPPPHQHQGYLGVGGFGREGVMATGY